MTLLQDIIREATAARGDIPRLLRLCMVLGAKLKHGPLQQWCRYELEGYPPSVELPSYRLFAARNRGEMIGPYQTFQGVFDIPISVLPERLQEHYRVARFGEALAAYAQLGGKPDEGDSVMFPWPQEAAVHYGAKAMTPGTQCVRAWMEVSQGAVAGLLDQVKTRVLAFALEIEQESPNAGEVGGLQSEVEKSKVTQIFNTTITGNVQNYAAGNLDVSQSAVSNVRVGDWASLATVLSGAGVPQADIASLREAVETESSPGNGPGQRVKQWLADLAIKGAQGFAGIGADVVAGVVTHAVLAYYGMAAA